MCALPLESRVPRFYKKSGGGLQTTRSTRRGGRYQKDRRQNSHRGTRNIADYGLCECVYGANKTKPYNVLSPPFYRYFTKHPRPPVSLRRVAQAGAAPPPTHASPLGDRSRARSSA